MNPLIRQILFWLALYVGFLVLPLVLAYLPPRPAPRAFLTEFAVALGFVGLALMGVQFYLTARFRRTSPPFGADSIWQFHRQAGIIALPMILAHPVLLFISNRQYLAYLDPRVNFLRTSALLLAMIFLLLLVVLPLWREKIGLSYEWWRLTHGIMAAVVMLVGLAHVLQVGHYVREWWHQAVWSIFCGTAIVLLLYVRIGKPLRMKRRPHRVIHVREEPGRVWTLAVEPDGHPPRPFRAGQYVWITLADSPFSLQQNPYSFSSSAERPERLEFTIKAFGDFSGSIRDVKPGDRAYLEGPYGWFTFEYPDAKGAVFIVGGIGVTPAMSMLRTLRDRRDPRHFVVIYGNTVHDEIVFKDELEEMTKVLDLRVVHVVEEHPESWTGLSGRLTEEILHEHLPERAREFHYYVCGPDPMMDLAEKTLLDKGLPVENVHVERFQIV